VILPSVRSRRIALGIAIATLGAASPSSSEQEWVAVRSARFEVLSDAGLERARAVAVRLEQFRRVLQEVLGRAEQEADPDTVVIAFRDQESFAPFLPVYRGRPQEVEGYFQAGSDRDYIAATVGSPHGDPHETVFHEYAHVVLNRTLSAQPLWLGEGLAEAFSRWTAAGAEALVGQTAPEHLRRLQRGKPLPLRRLLRVDYASPLYNEGDERAMLYARSWALAHWVAFGRGPLAPADLKAFLSAIANGVEAEVAFSSAFGAEVDGAERLLAAYVAAPLPVARFGVPGLEADVTVEARNPARAEVEYRLGDLLLHGGRLADARRHLERAIQNEPRFAPAHAALAQAAVRQGRWEEARREVGLALAAAPADAVALYGYAETIVRETSARSEVLSPEREAEAVAALERAVLLEPQMADACDLLARLRPEPYDKRIAQVTAALARHPARADLGLTLAGLHARKNDFTAARAVLVRTGAVARDDVHRFLSQHLLSRLDQHTAGTTEVKGTLLALECPAEGALRFVVGRGQQRLRLEAPSPTGVFLYGRDGSQVERTFTCGAQGEPVTARYRPAGASSPDAADGTLMSLTFESR
jgi:tetratricopeptide (TPR) repeat protein